MHTPGHRFYAGKGANTYHAAAGNTPENTECKTATAPGEAANERDEGDVGGETCVAAPGLRGDEEPAVRWLKRGGRGRSVWKQGQRRIATPTDHPTL